MNMLSLLKQKSEYLEKFRDLQEEITKEKTVFSEKQEGLLMERLQEALNIDVRGIVEEMEQAASVHKKQSKNLREKTKREAVAFAKREKKRTDHALMTYGKLGCIKALHKLYENAPHLRMKYANDWQSDQAPTGLVSTDSGFKFADLQFVQEMDASGRPLTLEGHDGYCNTIKAHCHAAVGNKRYGRSTAWTRQDLIFRHSPPPTIAADSMWCAVNEVWTPLTINGTSMVESSTALFLSLANALQSGARNEIKLTIRVEQDTNRTPLVYQITEDQLLFDANSAGTNWFFGGLGTNAGTITEGHVPIVVTLQEPYRLPVMLLTEDYGGREECH